MWILFLHKLKSVQQLVLLWYLTILQNRKIFTATYGLRHYIIPTHIKSVSTNLAKLMRALWPPLRDTPLSPIMVLSPCGNSSRSLSRAQTRITSLYLGTLYGCPNKMFCLTVPTNSHGSCELYAISPPTIHEPFDRRNSPSTACSNELYKIKVCVWLVKSVVWKTRTWDCINMVVWIHFRK